jgi:hypothetical protein
VASRPLPLSYGEGVAYWALAEMVRMRCGIVEDEPQASALEKLRATIDEHISDPDERRYVEPRLSHLLGLEEGVAGDQENLFAAWRILFERLADRGPTVLVFEDMQWADAGLIDFPEYLLDWSRNHPLFVVALARPELAEKRPSWGAGKRSFSSLYIEPLPPQAMTELLAGLVPGLPPQLHADILDQAEGIPLYAVETVRMLLDRGLLVQEGHVYTPTGPIETLEVPDTLQALIAARLDSLRPPERKLIQDASVLGKTFTRLGLGDLSGLSEAELDPLRWPRLRAWHRLHRFRTRRHSERHRPCNGRDRQRPRRYGHGCLPQGSTETGSAGRHGSRRRCRAHARQLYGDRCLAGRLAGRTLVPPSPRYSSSKIRLG